MRISQEDGTSKGDIKYTLDLGTLTYGTSIKTLDFKIRTDPTDGASDYAYLLTSINSALAEPEWYLGTTRPSQTFFVQFNIVAMTVAKYCYFDLGVYNVGHDMLLASNFLYILGRYLQAAS